MDDTNKPQKPLDELLAHSRSGDGWVVEVCPNRGHPVTDWMVIGPFYDHGSPEDGQGGFELMFEDRDEALDYAHEAANNCPEPAKVIVYPPDPVA